MKTAKDAVDADLPGGPLTEENGWFRRRTAAKYIGQDEGTLANWHSSRRFPALRCFRVGRYCFYRREDLDRFIVERARS